MPEQELVAVKIDLTLRAGRPMMARLRAYTDPQDPVGFVIETITKSDPRNQVVKLALLELALRWPDPNIQFTGENFLIKGFEVKLSDLANIKGVIDDITED